MGNRWSQPEIPTLILFVTLFAFCVSMLCCTGSPGPVVSPEDSSVILDSSVTPQDVTPPADRLPEERPPPLDTGQQPDRSSEICTPSPTNPDCAGARECDCRLTPDLMPPVCSDSPELRTMCNMVVFCRPGFNHCTIHLPLDVPSRPFECTASITWRPWDCATGTAGFEPLVTDDRGNTYVGPLNLGQGAEGIFACSGLSCYSFAGLAAQRNWARIRFERDVSTGECWRFQFEAFDNQGQVIGRNSCTQRF